MSTPSKSWISTLLSICLWPSRVLQSRRDLALLASLDDRGLADIGLSRQDLRDATAFARSEDPTARFAERARDRAEAALAARTQAQSSKSQLAPRQTAYGQDRAA